MPRAKQVKSKVIGISRTSGILVLAWLLLGWSRQVLSAEESAVPEPTLQLAPIQIGFSKGGNIGYLQRYDDMGSTKSLQRIYGLTVGVGVTAESFIWQPWLVKVGTHLNASVNSDISDSASNSWSMSKLARSGESVNRTITGGADMRVLPLSRFPFEASFTRNDNRREIGLVKSRYATLTDTLRLSQSYRNPSGRSRYLVTYNLGRAEDIDSNVEKNSLVNLDISLQPFTRQTLQIDGVKERRTSTLTDSTYLNNSFISRHTYRPDAALSVATMASYSDTGYRFSQGQGETGLETLQFSSAGTWRPPDSRLTMTGGLRLFDASSRYNGTSTSQDSYTGANLGANYALNNWLRLYGSADVSDSQGKQTVSSLAISNLNLSIAAQHRPKAIKVGSFNYNRYIAANLSNSTTASSAKNSAGTTSAAGSTLAFSLRLQHGLDSNAELGTGRLTSAVSQALTTSTSRSSTASRGTSPIVNLIHNGSLSWLKGRTGLRLSGSDTREMTQSKGYFQSINLQGSQSESFRGNGILNGDLTINMSRQGYDAAPIPATESLTSTATLNYINPRVFKVRNLAFRSSLRVISADLLQSNSMNQNTQNQGQYSWDNTLTYTIGKLRTEVRGVIEEVHSSKQASLIFFVSRWF
ncbi:MAG: hypothetical protein HY938_00025 [Nitrosomonadales bacterium]|nr:hypothetical protein [Nitrosomonadales bacterium]